jgi:hypothetical protein
LIAATSKMLQLPKPSPQRPNQLGLRPPLPTLSIPYENPPIAPIAFKLPDQHQQISINVDSNSIQQTNVMLKVSTFVQSLFCLLYYHSFCVLTIFVSKFQIDYSIFVGANATKIVGSVSISGKNKYGICVEEFEMK